MNNTPTDVIVHTRLPLSRDQFEEVANQVRAIDGVISFDRRDDKPNFILARYDAGRTKSLAILNKVTRLGFNASLVGI